MAFQSLYDTLGVAQAATAEQIKDAYRRQAMKWHPDRNPDKRAEAEERFKEIGTAYKVLSNPLQRAEYDAYLASQQFADAEQKRQKAADAEQKRQKAADAEQKRQKAADAERQRQKAADAERQRQKGPSFGAGISEAEAAKMFFEQVLDLAFELARRGFDESKILKMLLALDCPENVAKAAVEIVKNATQRGDQSKRNTGAHDQNTDSYSGTNKNRSTPPSDSLKPRGDLLPKFRILTSIILIGGIVISLYVGLPAPSMTTGKSAEIKQTSAIPSTTQVKPRGSGIDSEKKYADESIQRTSPPPSPSLPSTPVSPAAARAAKDIELRHPEYAATYSAYGQKLAEIIFARATNYERRGLSSESAIRKAASEIKREAIKFDREEARTRPNRQTSD